MENNSKNVDGGKVSGSESRVSNPKSHVSSPKAQVSSQSSHTARALGSSLPMSLRYSINICDSVRGRPVAFARQRLEDAISMRRPIKFTTSLNGLGHKPGSMGPGRYAVRCCSNILSVINSAVSNAEQKGLNVKRLVIKSMVPSKGPTIMRNGRHGGQAKKTHLLVVVGEGSDGFGGKK